MAIGRQLWGSQLLWTMFLWAQAVGQTIGATERQLTATCYWHMLLAQLATYHMPTVTCTTFDPWHYDPNFSRPQKEVSRVSPLTQTHKRHRMQPRLDDRVLDAFFLGLPGRCRSLRCSAFKLWCFVPKNQNEATYKKKQIAATYQNNHFWSCLQKPSHFVSDVFFWDFASLPFHQQQIQQCFFPCVSQKKKRNMSRNLERWPFPSMVYRLHPDISTGLRCSQDKCCVSPFLKSREMSERTHDPNGTAFMAHRTTFALTTWQFIHSKVLPKQQQGGGNIDEKHGSKVWFIFLHIKATSVLLNALQHLLQWFDVEAATLLFLYWKSWLHCLNIWHVGSSLRKGWVLKNRRLLFLAGTSGWWVLSEKTKQKKGSQQQNMIHLNIHFHKIQHLIAGNDAWKEAFFPAFPFFRFRLIFAHRFKQFSSWGTPKNHPPRYLQLAPLSRLGPTSAERKFFTERNGNFQVE